MSKIYAVIGTNSMTVVADSVKYNPQTNEVLMQSERPSDGDYVADENGHWVEDKQKKLDELDAQFRVDQATIMEYFTQAVFDGDAEAQAELKEEMEEIKTTYAEERKKLEEAD
jgi:hypothetical protein